MMIRTQNRALTGFRSINSRISFWIFSALTAILLVVFALAVAFQVRTAQQAVTSDTEFLLDIGESALKAALWDMNESNLQEVMGQVIQQPMVVQVSILTLENKILLNKSKSHVITGLIETPTPDLWTKNAVFKAERLIEYNDKPLGILRLGIVNTPYRLQLLLTILGWVISALALLLVVWGVIRWVSHRTTAPVIRLSQVATRIAEGDYSANFDKVSDDEVGQLSLALQVMQSQIQQHIQTLEQDRAEINVLYQQTAAMNDELHSMLDVVEANFEQTLKSLANAIEANDLYTKGHCERVKDLALMLGHRLALDKETLKALEHAAILHDIGKIGVPSQILNKEGAFTQEEQALVRKHSEIGSQIIGNIDFLASSVPIVHQHHERIDGTGYPQGLTGDAIHLGARILAIADAYDAMTSSRAYRKQPLDTRTAIHELEKWRGRQFDPELVGEFILGIQEMGDQGKPKAGDQQ